MARSRVANTVAGAIALAVGATLLLVTVPSQANHTTGAGTFTCRASTVRTENSTVTLLNQEPFVANRNGAVCETDAAGILNKEQNVDLGTLGTVKVAYAETDATTNTADAGVARADLLVAGTPIRATILTSTASAGTCPAPAFTSSSTIASVTVGNTTVAVPTTADASPDVTLPADLGFVYLNYQTTTTGSDQVRTQRALYVDVNQTLLPLVPDVIIAEAIADMHGNPCAQPTTTTSSTTSTSSTSTTSTSTTTTTTTTIAGRCPAPSPEGKDNDADKDCGYGQPSSVTKRPKN